MVHPRRTQTYAEACALLTLTQDPPMSADIPRDLDPCPLGQRRAQRSHDWVFRNQHQIQQVDIPLPALPSAR